MFIQLKSCNVLNKPQIRIKSRMKVEMKKLQTEITGCKILVGEMITPLESLSNRVIVIDVPEIQEENPGEESTVKDIIAQILTELKSPYKQIQHALRVPAKRDSTQYTSTYKNRILKSALSKRKIRFKEGPLIFTVDLS